MIRIADLARINKVSIKTLRYYEQVGLLRPSHVDNVSGYRYYSASQLPRLTRILFFKKLGFSLTQIQSLLREHTSSLHLRKVLQVRRADLLDNMSEEQNQLAQVETLLKRIEGEGTFRRPEVRELKGRLRCQVGLLIIVVSACPISFARALPAQRCSLSMAWLAQKKISMLPLKAWHSPVAICWHSIFPAPAWLNSILRTAQTVTTLADVTQLVQNELLPGPAFISAASMGGLVALLLQTTRPQGNSRT